MILFLSGYVVGCITSGLFLMRFLAGEACNSPATKVPVHKETINGIEYTVHDYRQLLGRGPGPGKG